MYDQNSQEEIDDLNMPMSIEETESVINNLPKKKNRPIWLPTNSTKHLKSK